jgi:Na+/H+ antiporter NhaA
MQTVWARVATPLRAFIQAESGGAVVLVAAALAALAWANIDSGSYASVWSTELSIRLGDWTLSDDVRHWVNDGLMVFFFFVLGLEARREFDLGELRERRRVMLPAVAALAGMTLPIAIYLAFNAGGAGADGWGIAMSTDTAFALGVLALVGPTISNRLRAFLVTVVVVDDLVALCVIGLAYTHDFSARGAVAAAVLFAVVLLIRALGVRRGPVYFAFGVAIWGALHSSGIDPVVVGLLFGLLTYAYSASREDLERASELFRLFREQPTSELARSASAGVTSAISPNERLQQLYHPWSSYVIVPLFALANAGIVLNGDTLSRGWSSPITLGIAVGYVVGKPVGIVAASFLASRRSLRMPVGWGALAGAGSAAGVGFTVALLIADRGFSGARLEEAKLGVIASAVLAPLVSLAVFRVIARLPLERRLRALVGASETLEDLAVAVDAEYDHLRGAADAPVTLVEYGDFECPYCGRAEPIVRELLADFGDLRYVWRHLPLTDVHPHAQLAAEASEAAAAQGAFWDMHDLLFEHQDALRGRDLVGYAEELGLDIEQFVEDLHAHRGADRVARDVDSADLSGVSGTPTFFVNGRRHHGAYDVATLSAAVRTARARALVRPNVPTSLL